MKKVVLLALAALSLAGCNQQAQIDQSKICAYGSDQEAKLCKSGELALFAPSRWGNEQLPLRIAAAYCDLNYEVMHNSSGVLCVFTDKRLHTVE